MNIPKQLICARHSSPILFICTVDSCKDRYICELCKNKETHHFSYHSNYIYKMKEFYQCNNYKLLCPRLEKGINDSENFINSHKIDYEKQLKTISEDFKIIQDIFHEVTEKYKSIYLEKLIQEKNMFDKEVQEIKDIFKEYQYEKNQQESFFTKLFSNDKNQGNVDDIISKNSKAFKVRANIISLRSKIATAKTTKISYKPSEKEEKFFEECLEYFSAMLISFYDKFKDLISHENGNPTSSLKSSIIQETKSLSNSRAISSNSFLQSNSQKSIMSEKGLVRTNLPEMHPNVKAIYERLEPFTMPQFNKPDEGPYRYNLGVYYGTYDGSVRSGKGIFVFSKDGSYYEGTWENDNMSGKGRIIKKNSYYQGEIKDGVAHGKGAFEDQFRTYKGDWINDQRNGMGQENIKKRRVKYNGRFINDDYNGSGKLMDDELVYEGSFKNGLFEGEGVIRYKNGEIFTGKFKEGNKSVGRHVMADSSFYEGSFKDNLPHGDGQFYWADGIKYKGQWKNGLQDGIGIETLEDGKQLKGLWQNGTWLRWL